MEAQEKRRGGGSFGEKFSEFLAPRQGKSGPQMPRTPVVLDEPHSKIVSGGVSAAYMQALMSHTKERPQVLLAP